MPFPPQLQRPAARFAVAMCVASAAVALVAAPSACTQAEQLEEGVHTWGTFDLCLRRTSDTCHDAGEACTTLPTDDTRSVLVGVKPETGEFFYTLGNVDPARGAQRGDRFEIVRELSLPSVCDCRAKVTETIRGELSALAIPAIDCTEVDGGSNGCTGFPADAGPEDASTDSGPDFAEGWLDGADAGFDLDARYSSLRARIVDEVVSDEPTKACPCLPCTVVYDVTGRP